MVNFKWDQKCALENAKEKAERNAAIRNAISLLQDGIPLKSIMNSTYLSLEEIRKLAKDNGLAF
ncbi:hypothetical protein [Mitsuokella multacida]